MYHVLSFHVLVLCMAVSQVHEMNSDELEYYVNKNLNGIHTSG